MEAGSDFPETRFASLGEDRIAYQVFGEGDIDLLYTSATGDPIDLRWEWPAYATFLRRLGAQARVIMFDRRGSGSSDSASGESLPSAERWADDARVVLDAVGSERAVLFGSADGGPAAILFAASHPVRTRALILAMTAGVVSAEPDSPEATAAVDSTATAEFVAQAWGTPALAEFTMPDAARDPAFVRWFGRACRLSYSPRDSGTLIQWETGMDVRGALGSVQVPTLVLHREGYQAIPLDHAKYLAEHISGARLAVLPGRDGYIFTEPAEDGVHHIEQFLGGLDGMTESDRALAAILFTDFVGSTNHLSALGDRAWRDLLDSHDVIARTAVEQHGGRLVRTTGDGILATFDGPGRAIRCARALGDALQPLGVEIRAGLHAGEVENRGTGIDGIAVHIAARVVEAAAAGELLVSAAVPMLVAGSGIEFDDRGEHQLKGVPGTWQLFAVQR